MISSPRAMGVCLGAVRDGGERFEEACGGLGVAHVDDVDRVRGGASSRRIRIGAALVRASSVQSSPVAGQVRRPCPARSHGPGRDLETARAVADTVAGLHDSLEAGSGIISGSAARRAIRAAAAAPRFAGTPITLASARKLLKNEDAMIYDNPHALVLCHYKRDKALCHRDGVRDTPASTGASPAAAPALPAPGPSPSPSRPPTPAAPWPNGSTGRR
jgi:hypothetical protein